MGLRLSASTVWSRWRYQSAPSTRAPGRPTIREMNILSALAPTTIPVDPVEGIQGQVAFAAAVKAVKVQQEMAKSVVQLLDPNIGRNLNVSA